MADSGRTCVFALVSAGQFHLNRFLTKLCSHGCSWTDTNGSCRNQLRQGKAANCLRRTVPSLIRRVWQGAISGRVTAGLRPDSLRDVAGAIEGIVEVVRAGQKEKVVRVGLLALKQLLQDPSLGYDTTLVDAGLLKLVTTRSLQARGPLTLALTSNWSITPRRDPSHGARLMFTKRPEG